MNEWMIPAAGVLALVFAFWKATWVNRQDPGNEKMVEIGKAVREGAMAFLAREYRVLAIFVVIVAVLLFVFYSKGGTQMIAVSFIVGALCSGLAGFIGMRVATAANNRTTQAARQSLNAALGVAFSGGTVMGMGVVGLGVLGLSGLWLAWRNDFSPFGLALGFSGVLLGAPYLTAYLLVASFQVDGNVAALLLGERRARELTAATP